MKRHEAVIATALAFLMVSAGLTWRFGFYGLIVPGALLLLTLLLFFDFQVKE